jgi:tetratricopeptide (TPR) repeat protein
VLDERLAEAPEDYEAWIESALAWQDLRSPAKSVECFEKAADCTTDVNKKVSAKSKAMLMLTSADNYEKAVEIAQQVVEMQPDSPLRPLQLGMIHLQGSQASQRAVLERLKIDPLNKRMVDVRREKQVEEYVSDIWRDPLMEPLLDELGANDAVVRAEVRSGLTDARDRFRLAYHALLPYPQWGEFDASIARAYCQVLQRAGQLYDAHIEASMALREKNLPLGMVRDLLEVQANCSLAIGDDAQAADRYALILQAYLEQAPDRMPYHLAQAEYALRIKARQWDWILEHVEADSETYGDPVLQWAKAAALAATGRRDEARLEIAEPFNAVALGTETFTPPSLRAYPDRRREIAMLAYQLFSEVGDSKAGVALDALLAQVPDDAEALRLHAELSLAADDLEGARRDAFALLTRGRRDHADYLLWMDVADRISLRRHGVSLEARARFKVAEYHRSTENRTAASVEEFKILGLTPGQDLLPKPSDPLYIVGDPAFTLSIVDELVASGDTEKALTEMRKLLEEYPEAQELRFRLGLLLVRAGLYESALQKFEELLAKVPDDVEALDLAMRTNRALGRRQEAANLLDRMILDDPLAWACRATAAPHRRGQGRRRGPARRAHRALDQARRPPRRAHPRGARPARAGQPRPGAGDPDQPRQPRRPHAGELAAGPRRRPRARPDRPRRRGHRGHPPAAARAAARPARGDRRAAQGRRAHGGPGQALHARDHRPALGPAGAAHRGRRPQAAGRLRPRRRAARRARRRGRAHRPLPAARPAAAAGRAGAPAAARPVGLRAHPGGTVLPHARERARGRAALTDSRSSTRSPSWASRPDARSPRSSSSTRCCASCPRSVASRTCAPRARSSTPRSPGRRRPRTSASCSSSPRPTGPPARRLGRDLLFLALIEQRDFWTREATALADQLLVESPGLSLPHRVSRAPRWPRASRRTRCATSSRSSRTSRSPTRTSTSSCRPATTRGTRTGPRRARWPSAPTSTRCACSATRSPRGAWPTRRATSTRACSRPRPTTCPRSAE